MSQGIPQSLFYYFTIQTVLFLHGPNFNPSSWWNSIKCQQPAQWVTSAGKAESRISSISLQLPSQGIPPFWWLQSLFKLNTAHQHSNAEISSGNVPPLSSPRAFASSGDTSGAGIGVKQIFGCAKAPSHLHCVTRIFCDLQYSITVPHCPVTANWQSRGAELSLHRPNSASSIRNLRVSGGFSELLQHHHCRWCS